LSWRRGSVEGHNGPASGGGSGQTGPTMEAQRGGGPLRPGLQGGKIFPFRPRAAVDEEARRAGWSFLEGKAMSRGGRCASPLAGTNGPMRHGATSGRFERQFDLPFGQSDFLEEPPGLHLEKPVRRQGRDQNKMGRAAFEGFRGFGMLSLIIAGRWPLRACAKPAKSGVGRLGGSRPRRLSGQRRSWSRAAMDLTSLSTFRPGWGPRPERTARPIGSGPGFLRRTGVGCSRSKAGPNAGAVTSREEVRPRRAIGAEGIKPRSDRFRWPGLRRQTVSSAPPVD